MANRKKPTNKELLDMNLWLREQLSNVHRLSQDTAYILKTYVTMKGDDDALFREIRKNQENEAKNKQVQEKVMKGIENANKEKINKAAKKSR